MKRIRLHEGCFLGTRGSINTHIGMDLFATLLLVFLISTALLLKTPRDNTETKPKEEEMTTPDIEISLPEDRQGGLLAGREGAIKISARLQAKGDVEFFVDSEKTTLQGIAGLLKQKGSRRVELRLDENLTNAVTVKILGQLQQANVRQIYYVFIQK